MTIDAFHDQLFLRKLWHLSFGGVLVAMLALLDRNWCLAACAVYFLGLWFLARRISFGTLGIMLLLMLSGARFATFLTVLIWVVGDGLAGILGAAYGRRKWTWYPQKSVVGTLSFFLGAMAAALVALQLSVAAPLATVIALSAVPSLAAAVVEILPITFIRDRKPDDNLLIILSTGLVVNVLIAGLGVEGGF
jgi:dolichol kinase